MSAAMKPVRRGPTLETMKRTIRRVTPWLAAAAIGGALVFAPVASAAPGNAGDGSGTPGHVAPSPYGSGTSPFVGGDTWAPGDQVPYDPYIKNPGGGVDLAS
jgi:hypothetical protein